jgi:hypothetical protein
LAIIFSCLLPARAGALTAEEAENLSRQNGRPILIVAGRDTCGLTQGVLHHLQEPAIAPLASQYVNVYINVDAPEGAACQQKYGRPGDMLPYVYVVRADGEKLFMHSGMIESGELRELLLAQAAKAGKAFSDKEMAMLEKALEEAKRAQKKGDTMEAIKALLTLKKLGPIGNLNSYAKPAVEANKFVSQLTKEGKKRLKNVDEKFSAGNVTFDAALAYAKTKRTFATLPTLKSDLTTASRKYERMRDLADTLRQAEAIDRAQVLAASHHNTKRATEAFQRVVSAYPGTEAAKVAADELKKLGAQPGGASAAEAQKPALRTWTDTTGQFSVKARCRGVKDGKLLLEKENGRTVQVPLDKLSEEDREYLKSHPAE